MIRGTAEVGLAFGIVVLIAGVAWSRRHVDRPDHAPLTRKLIHALSGRGLRVVAAHVEELARFTREIPPTESR